MSEDTPNKALDKAVKALLEDSAKKEADELQLERRRKAILAAISWEKVKKAIMGEDDPFSPEDL